MKVASLSCVFLFAASLSMLGQTPPGVAVVLRATPGKWFVESETSSINAGRELAAKTVVVSRAANTGDKIIIKVYDRPKPDSYTAPGRITLPDTAVNEPGVFEEFLRLYHRLIEPPPVGLQTTLSETNPFTRDLLVAMDPLSHQASGDYYVVKKYTPLTEGLTYNRDASPTLAGSFDKTLWSDSGQIKFEHTASSSAVTSAATTHWYKEIAALEESIRQRAVTLDAVLTSQGTLVDLSPAFTGSGPTAPVRIRAVPTGKSRPDLSNLTMVLSWTTAEGQKPSYTAPLANGLYKMSYFDVSLQQNVGTECRVFIVSPSARDQADRLLADFHRHISSWGELLDSETRRSLTQAFFLYMAESGTN